VTLAELLLASPEPSAAAIREWLPTAAWRALTAQDLDRIDSYGSTDGRALHASLPLLLPLERSVWYEADVVAKGGSTMVLGYGAAPAGRHELGVWFAAHKRGTATVIGPLGPMRIDAHSIDTTVDVATPGARELRAAAGIVIRALLLGL
jgi:hypothetical protein